MALVVRRRLGLAGSLRSAASLDHAAEETLHLLGRTGLAERAETPVHALSYGEQRQVEVALALASDPAVLLLDEPMAGMSPAETLSMTALIKGLPGHITVLIIEHDMDVVFALADRITVLDFGEVLAEGRPEEVRANPAVQEAYLGGTAQPAPLHI